jgi:DNA-binding NarL/FixJ family response regulator
MLTVSFYTNVFYLPTLFLKFDENTNVTNNNLQSLGVTSCLQSTQEHTFFDLLIVDNFIPGLTNVKTLSEIREKYPSLKTILLIDEEHKPVALTYLRNGLEGICMNSIRQQDFLHTCAMI